MIQVFNFNLDKELNNILLSYYLYLKQNNFSSKKSIEYIHYILENLDIKKYANKIIFEKQLLANGFFDPNHCSITINENYLKKMQLAYNMNFLKKEIIIIEFLTLLFHEIKHILQFKTKTETSNITINDILNISSYLKQIANKREKYFHNLFPDEIDANISSGLFIYNFANQNKELELDLENAEKNLIYYLTLEYITNGEILPCSQIKFLYHKLLNQEFLEEQYNLKDFENIFYGFTKTEEQNKKLLKSYQTQKLCLDIK